MAPVPVAPIRAVRDGEEQESGRRVLPRRSHRSGLDLGIGTETDNGEAGGGVPSFELGGSYTVRQGKGMDSGALGLDC
jgi:hypothetical protein